MHSFMTSLAQAARCAAVGLNSADAAVGSKLSSTSVPKIPRQTVSMIVLLGVRWRRRRLTDEAWYACLLLCIAVTVVTEIAVSRQA
jgi:hypothetical protein